MAKTKIEWLRDPITGKQGYSINPVKGLCPMACSYCYARKMYKRFKWNPEIRYDPSVFMTLPNKPSRVFVGSTMELFGNWVPWMENILSLCRRTSEHTFIFLTKQPQNLAKWSPFPPNCWVGVTATNQTKLIEARHYLEGVEAATKFVSLEPFLEWHTHKELDWLVEVLKSIDWLIIGAQTKPTILPKIEWVREICGAADKAGIPVFIKDSLKSLAVNAAIYPHMKVGDEGWDHLRQEMPDGD